MKKIYSLLLLVVTSVSFGQIFSDDLNYPDAALLTANGWTAHSGAGTNAIDVGASNGLTYTGYSGLTGFTAAAVGNAALLDNTGEDVNKTFAAPVTTGTLYYTFLVNVTAATEGYFTHLGSLTTFAARVFVKPSVNAGKINFGLSNTGTASYAVTPTDYDLNTTYLVIVKYDVSTTGAASIWVRSAGIPANEVAAGTPEHTTTGSGMASIAGVYLRQYNAGQNITVDGLRVYGTWFNTSACPLTLAAETKACDANTLNIDTYTVTVPFTGGNSGAYTLSSNVGTVGGDNPNTTAEGNITISGITEGTNVTLTITGACTITKSITAPECKPINPLPYAESFPYTSGNALGLEQKWTNVNTGDNIVVADNSLFYTNFASSGNQVTFSGAGAEAFTPYTTTTSGTLYASFLMSVTSLDNVTTDGTATYFAGLTDAAKGYNSRVFIKKTGTQYQLGLDTASTTTNYDATLRNTGDIVFVVLGYDFGTNELKMWIDPSPISFTAATPATLTNTPAATYTDLGGFILRQDGGASTPSISFDELRVATTTPDLFLSVAQNEIAGLNVYPNPANNVLFIETELNDVKNIAIYDLLGKQVLNTTTASTEVNVSNLNSGLYIVKITEAGKTATKKLVIE
ncbi:T9SS type A sorting domain-containing protein [Flavobacterium sp.]|uniref:T9SS type A sorting domain-containing protein n=1 Tax=Flavobacterium sp. TaxID=239 RepID=UPI002B4B2283|nr:T9SS type A sorting domain-containing protein [Flavobacterium sp.]HLP63528.1 T9SS type A sorting domain-containing protein [Flavobacterium sp.]